VEHLFNKKNIDKVTELGLIFAIPRGKTYQRQWNSKKNEEKAKVTHKRYSCCIFVYVIVVFVSTIIIDLSLTSHIKFHDLIIYNALIIAAAIFLLTYHLEELRDVTTFIAEGRFIGGRNKPFHFWKENKTQGAGVAAVQNRAFVISTTLIAIIFFILSSFIIIASVDSFYLIIAFDLSIIGSLVIMANLFYTFYLYLKTLVTYADTHPYKK
jgi:uncharacterized Tic20 family protein